MLSEVMEYYGISRSFRHAGYFETDHHRQVFKEMEKAIHRGELVAMSGIVGCGKTTTLLRIQEALREENQILVSRSLAVDKGRVNLKTLIMALFYDLAIDKDVKVPTQAEKRERLLLSLIEKRGKPVALFIDEAHDLHHQTLIQLKRLIELIRSAGATRSVVLAGHPKLKNDMENPTLEEIGARSTLFVLDGIKGEQEGYIRWLLGECTKDEIGTLITDEAIAQLAKRLTTPLQIEQYLTLAFEQAYQVGEKPVTTEIIDSVMAPGLNDLEPKLARHGYNVKVLALELNVRQTEIRSYLHGQLAPGRTEELYKQLLTKGIPA
jgi:type II secretory pathway predicted ATPase ExeA